MSEQMTRDDLVKELAMGIIYEKLDSGTSYDEAWDFVNEHAEPEGELVSQVVEEVNEILISIQDRLDNYYD